MHGDGEPWNAIVRIRLVGDHIVLVVWKSFVDQVHGHPGCQHVHPEGLPHHLGTSIDDGTLHLVPNELFSNMIGYFVGWFVLEPGVACTAVVFEFMHGDGVTHGKQR